MSGTSQLLLPPGEPIPLGDLKTPKGRAFAQFLRSFSTEAYASLVETRRRNDVGADVIVFRVQVQRPQKVVHPICREEVLAAVFTDADNNHPEVLAMRAGFPWVPHGNLRDSELPRSLCLYDQPFENTRHDWTPARFLHRVRWWLEKTATGTLHGDDQPLEPLIQAAPARLILPVGSLLSELSA